MENHDVRKAVLPVAGMGTRFLPATIAMPKEMLPLVDKPVIQYLVEEAADSGIKEMVMVTGRTKRAIEDHFDASFELEHALKEKGKDELVKEIKRVSKLAQFIYVRQKEPKGDGDAILNAESVIGDNPFAVLFGDDLVTDCEQPCLKQLIDVYQKYDAPVVAVTEVPDNMTHHFGVIKGVEVEPGVYQVESLVEKPKENPPSNLAIVGKYIMTPDIFGYIKKSTASVGDGEIRLADGMIERLKDNKPIYALKFKGTWYSTGHKLDYLKATVAYALKHKDHGHEFKKFLTEYLKKDI
ncbi:UTP--glucose-1-phosphate uridylyltransferase GalU [bacterium]|nr:UTP--glucose-1-phosphate uridylyltransferase GalU [bacterium]